MELTKLFQNKLSFFDADLKTKKEVIDFLVSKLKTEKVITDEKVFKEAILKREGEFSTGIGDAIATPHAINEVVTKPTIAFMKLKNPIEWGSMDNKPVSLVFMIATNDTSGDTHLAAIGELSTVLVKEEIRLALMEVKNFKSFISALEVKVESKKIAPKDGVYDVVGITACPTGIAHTYLAAEKLEEYATNLGLSVKIETQGRRGTENKLTQDEVDNAKVIILARDKNIAGMNRFSGKQIIETSTKDGIYNGKELIENFGKDGKTITGKNVSGNDEESGGEFSLKKFAEVKGNLLAGVSRMLPFVVAGGIILGIGFLIDFAAGNGEAGGNFGTVSPVAGWFSAIGKTSMMMMVPILSAYIAYTIVGPQGLMPGMIAGLLADGTGGFAYSDTHSGWSGLWSKLIPNNIPMNSGFIGGMVGAYAAGLIVFGLTMAFKKFNKSFHGVRDIVLIPVFSLLGICLTMFVINIPLGYTMYGIKSGLIWLSKQNLLILVAMIIGFMMCVDMGGPINKIAYTLGTLSVGGGLGSLNDNPQLTTIMAAAMAAGMIPPLGIAVSTIMFRKVWTLKEKDAAKSNWLLGAFFITEGAIPFMITDPKRIAVSGMAGGTITGLLVGAFKITLGAPHGGVAVFPLLKSYLVSSSSAAIGLGISLYILAIVVGTFTMATILGLWKTIDVKKGKLVIA
ncbi:PTS system, fructose-specific IIABC component [Entomoplasma ellychniae]|uniref:PTS system, fructose-specific IIABC component n=1 Tax=Entomoplasma ellychniae TaxID=2114 RepID=A0A8E2QZ55_9MOLU|nr:fructose-specific PTS transporter subunit EIIC [Entomoplasma ellychniae]PPE04974.1 PTS system, fructose-specific IIABC component [Entomoplasma ellychniae]